MNKPIEPGCLAYVTYSVRKPWLAWTKCQVIARCPEGSPTVEGEPTGHGEWDCDHPYVPDVAVFHEKQLMRIDEGDPDTAQEQDQEVPEHANA
ncbi:hypothetical protein SAMN04487958_107176 [Vreelandella subterranea]|uniref:Uncharacterized protein n=1 Tax=Vreelandella subterranea TaxID=416874 RepID=A0A1H9URT2_9GAMM|nr:hypothetical protein SAMN04487958_107176 [Halomonas subterranea]